MKKVILAIKRYVAVIVFLSTMASLTGCFDQREVDDLAYPLALGLDVGEVNALRMTLQMAKPLSIGAGKGGEGSGGGGSKGEEDKVSSIITVDTPSIYSGINLVNNIISKEINMSHAKVIVISRRLAEEGAAKYITAIQRGREFRPDAFVLVSDDPPDQYLRAVKPTLESNPSKYYELLLGESYNTYFPITRLSDFYHNIESDSIEPIAILTALGKYDSVDQFSEAVERKSTGTRELEGQYIAGNIPVVTEQKIEVMGTAVFKEGKMVGTLNGLESICHHMITGEYKRSYWTMPDPSDEKMIVVLNVSQRRKPSIKVSLADGKADVRIGIELEGDITSIQSKRDYGDYPEIIEQKIEEIIRNQILAFLNRSKNEFNSDICGIGEYVKGKFLTWESWKKYNWLERYKNTDFIVDIKFKIRRTGLLLK